MKHIFKIAVCAAGYAFLTAIYYIAQFLMRPKVYSVIMKTCGICCFLFAISALVKWYASPPAAAVAYVFVGLCGIFAKQPEKKEGEPNA